MEWHKRNPDMEQVEWHMMLTFPDRRSQVNKQIEITELTAEYPALFDFCQVECVCKLNFYIIDFVWVHFILLTYSCT